MLAGRTGGVVSINALVTHVIVLIHILAIVDHWEFTDVSRSEDSWSVHESFVVGAGEAVPRLVVPINGAPVAVCPVFIRLSEFVLSLTSEAVAVHESVELLTLSAVSSSVVNDKIFAAWNMAFVLRVGELSSLNAGEALSDFAPVVYFAISTG